MKQNEKKKRNSLELIYVDADITPSRMITASG